VELLQRPLKGGGKERRAMKGEREKISSRERGETSTFFEECAYRRGHLCVAGVDEAGRGALAGPVVASACVIPPQVIISGVGDSKSLSPQRREELYEILIRHPSVECGFGVVSNLRIDEKNILQASMEAMEIAVRHLDVRPDYLLADGCHAPNVEMEVQTLVKGDARSQTIGAASILAKVYRDRLMETYHRKWPIYRFDQNRGYGTSFHRQAIRRFGPCEIHRFSFAPIRSMTLPLGRRLLPV